MRYRIHIFFLAFLVATLAHAQEFIIEQQIIQSQGENDQTDGFGHKVIYNGEHLLISADNDKVSGKQWVGSVFCYRFNELSKSFELYQKLSNDQLLPAFFGDEMALLGNTLVIAAPRHYDDSAGKHFYNRGRIHIFNYENGSWNKQQVLEYPFEANTGELFFGDEMVLTDDFLFVGVSRATFMVNNDTLTKAGRCLIYKRDSSGKFTLNQVLTAPQISKNAYFGSSITYSDSFLAIAAVIEAIPEGVVEKGTVYIYKLSPDHEWKLIQKMKGEQTGFPPINGYGSPVTLVKDRLIIAYNGSFEDAEVFVYNQDSFEYLQDIEATANSQFVSQDDTLVVGQPSGTFLNINKTTDVGKIVYYIWEDGMYVKQDQFGDNFELGSSDHFANSIAFYNRRIIVGAERSSKAPDQSSMPTTGKVYVFKKVPCLNVNSYIDTSVCDEYRSPSSRLFEESGKYFDSVFYARNCHSAYEIDLEVRKSTQVWFDTTLCGVYTSPSGKRFYNTTYIIDTISNSQGCDSIMNIVFNSLNPIIDIKKTDTSLSVPPGYDHYQWLDCIKNYEEIEGETSYRYVPEKSGLYAVDVSHENCSSRSNCINIEIDSDLQTDGPIEVKAGPNPVEDELRIWVTGPEQNIRIQLFDVHGRLVFEKTVLGPGEYPIQIDMSPGMYILRISNNKESLETFKIIKAN
ncbi:T9SS type A sorting domain-containing protein [bacterium]|nr:T9SS type A sorting domain-containing protein [bacterium]